jgi:hypothetical protein
MAPGEARAAPAEPGRPSVRGLVWGAPTERRWPSVHTEDPGMTRGAPGRPGRPAGSGARYSRMVSNWNLQPTGVSALTALKPDIVS